VPQSRSPHADLILIDERKGKSVALAKGFATSGTLGVVRLAARGGLIDLPAVVNKLTGTNFRYRQEIIDDLLREFPSEPLGRPRSSVTTRIGSQAQ
jgi:predicted nucleic acid-binding protein